MSDDDDGWGGLAGLVSDAILKSFDWDREGVGMGNILFAACREAGFSDPIAVAHKFAEHAACNALAALAKEGFIDWAAVKGPAGVRLREPQK